MNILISQRDEKDAQYLEIAFKELGHRTNYIDTLDSIESLENLSSYDLVILDTVVGDISGIEVCKHIRESDKNIVIIFISDNDDTAIKIKAFDLGADDYITRPFAFAELVARVKSITRRKNPTEDGESILKVGDLILNYHTREVKRGDKLIELTTKEFLLLEYFMKNRNILLTRTLIREHIWGIDFLSDTNIVDVYITRLRNKIDKGYTNKFFYTIRGAGYMLKG
ncbi:Transcriptional activator protein CopR [Fusobacterium sp. DD29]|uniref:response regulator transcription factor n=1 Tax=unclassified Fusobacterium TaxID=2648384 RepID=UPI001B8D8938|nr:MULTISPECIES: response regulator transcription factor [unclassified Fusobacterium]MBR8701021.1 Transcriptional activator protein CopR [Fusobacterium sp. DD45]MBR8710793.1 Transcriptional activator protein CopR [Fusobacterium sp. DD28]MBR8750007.1 Transcriptional activator protein CopR [Fusobacterium sp. DD29]MBR8751429.1 Transcriptional activator protein CopR [Fusobacterium sp. DD26]MBR8762257.1 Transcriptional activator protein CopR [Fusobacterium sp. DD25]